MMIEFIVGLTNLAAVAALFAASRLAEKLPIPTEWHPERQT